LTLSALGELSSYASQRVKRQGENFATLQKPPCLTPVSSPVTLWGFYWYKVSCCWI